MSKFKLTLEEERFILKRRAREEKKAQAANKKEGVPHNLCDLLKNYPLERKKEICKVVSDFIKKVIFLTKSDYHKQQKKNEKLLEKQQWQKMHYWAYAYKDTDVIALRPTFDGETRIVPVDENYAKSTLKMNPMVCFKLPKIGLVCLYGSCCELVTELPFMGSSFRKKDGLECSIENGLCTYKWDTKTFLNHCLSVNRTDQPLKHIDQPLKYTDQYYIDESILSTITHCRRTVDIEQTYNADRPLTLKALNKKIKLSTLKFCDYSQEKIKATQSSFMQARRLLQDNKTDLTANEEAQ